MLTASCHLAHVPNAAAPEPQIQPLRHYIPYNCPARKALLSKLLPGRLYTVFLLFKPRGTNAPPEKFRHSSNVTHITMSPEPTIAWKASPTRTPPPICTSAPFLKPRWSYRSWAPRAM
ncbi:hypothetical protein BRAS3843_2770025 [Bradyrhizobium sp. STM 3843]|nr:hypothetical protein BRAS3843_2770025 [Bradyrhizobium sp. STM 3843]